MSRCTLGVRGLRPQELGLGLEVCGTTDVMGFLCYYSWVMRDDWYWAMGSGSPGLRLCTQRGCEHAFGICQVEFPTCHVGFRICQYGWNLSWSHGCLRKRWGLGFGSVLIRPSRLP